MLEIEAFDGQKKIILNYTAPVLQNQGMIKGAIVVNQDVTEKQRAEMDLIYAKEKAEESNRQKSAFLANMSHEIRTPMNGLPNQEAMLRTDREKVFTILTNLVKNAIKYTSSGAIELGYTPGPLPRIQVYVQDTGMGAPEERQEAISERFIPADIADKMAYQGAGLGLSISRAYVGMLGDTIWVESSEGSGSTFYFTLPYNPPHVRESANVH